MILEGFWILVLGFGSRVSKLGLKVSDWFWFEGSGIRDEG